MKPPIFLNKDNSLTAYAFRCGYVQEVEKDNLRIWLAWDINSYDVKAYDYNNHIRLAWETTDSLKEARKIYKQLIRKYHAK